MASGRPERLIARPLQASAAALRPPRSRLLAALVPECPGLRRFLSPRHRSASEAAGEERDRSQTPAAPFPGGDFLFQRGRAGLQARACSLVPSSRSLRRCSASRGPRSLWLPAAATPSICAPATCRNSTFASAPCFRQNGQRTTRKLQGQP